MLDRVWREHKASSQFRLHCQFVADIYLSLQSLVEKTGATLHFYPKTKLYGIKYLLLPNLDAYFSIEEKNGKRKSYFLNIFDELSPRMVLRKRVREYVEYYEDEDWQNHAQEPCPTIMVISS